MEVPIIIAFILVFVITISIGGYLFNSVIPTYQQGGSYSEMVLLINGTPTALSHDIATISSFSNVSVFSDTNSTNDPGNTTFYLPAIPYGPTMLQISGGGISNVTVNGYYIGSLNGSGGNYTFMVPPSDLQPGENTVIFG